MSKVFGLFISYNLRQVGSLYDRIGPKLWPTKNIEFFHSCDFDLGPMTLILKFYLDIMEMYLHTKNQVPGVVRPPHTHTRKHYLPAYGGSNKIAIDKMTKLIVYRWA